MMNYFYNNNVDLDGDYFYNNNVDLDGDVEIPNKINITEYICKDSIGVIANKICKYKTDVKYRYLICNVIEWDIWKK